MKDLEIVLDNTPGSLATMGEALGQHNISLEGGGVFQNGTTAIAHFLVSDAKKARMVLEKKDIKVTGIREVIVQKLRQDVPGQLGEFCRRLARDNVNILTQYSDHSNQLILVVDDYEKAREISAEWMQEWW